jgi:hypothetical protein
MLHRFFRTFLFFLVSLTPLSFNIDCGTNKTVTLAEVNGKFSSVVQQSMLKERGM